MRMIMAAAMLMATPFPALAQKQGDQHKQNDDSPVYYFDSDDVRMNAAIAKGRAGAPDFLRHYAAPAADESDFMVKFDLVEGEGAEYIWGRVLRHSNGTLDTVLINEPVAPDFRIGQKITIREAEIVDWSYRKAGVMQGAFTIRVTLDSMPPQEAEGYRRYYGW